MFFLWDTNLPSLISFEVVLFDSQEICHLKNQDQE